MLGVRVIDKFIDIFPVVNDELISTTMAREGYGEPSSMGGLYVETGGILKLEMNSTGRVRSVSVGSNTTVNGDVRRVLSTGTTATGVSILVI